LRQTQLQLQLQTQTQILRIYCVNSLRLNSKIWRSQIFEIEIEIEIEIEVEVEVENSPNKPHLIPYIQRIGRYFFWVK